MATRMIVTSQPDVACDVCGRRLLRGEQPDVFLASGRRLTVCELCAPRATHEGWLRESEQQQRDSLGLAPARARRGRSLLGRLRQRGRLAADRPASEHQPEMEAAFGSSPEGSPPSQEQPAPGYYDPLESLPVLAEEPVIVGISATEIAPERVSTGAEAIAQRALEVFNAGEHPRRVAGVARSLGAPSVSVRPPAEPAGTVVSIVVAWELSWYRYEVDLGEEAAGASVVAQGTELGELAGEDRLANAAASDDGALSMVGLVAR
jgi:hypothetical protein